MHPGKIVLLEIVRLYASKKLLLEKDELNLFVTISSHMVSSLTIVFVLRVRSRTLCAQWTCHVLSLVRLYSVPAPRITCHRLMYSYVPVPSYPFPLTCICTDIDCRLVLGTCLYSHFPFRVDDLYAYAFLLMLFPFVLNDLSMLTVTAYAFPFVACRLVFRFGL